MRVTDLSAGGCFIATQDAIPEGSDVTVRAKLGGVELSLSGRIVRVSPGHGVAVEFSVLASDTRYLLEQFLTRAPTA
jgi:hypothetical protein